MTPGTLDESLAHACRRWQNRTALSLQDQILTYGELADAITAAAGGFRRLAGLGPHDRVLTCISNRPELLVSLGAAWRCGAVHTGVDHQSTPKELGTAIDLIRPTLFVYEPPANEDPRLRIEPVRAAHPTLRIVLVGTPASSATDHTFTGLLAEAHRSTGDHRPAEPSDPALIFLSSGTTGQPKAALGFHGNLSDRWNRLGRWLEFGPSDVHLGQLPLSHGFGLMMAIAALLAGGEVALQQSFSGSGALDLVQRRGITVLNGAPAHFRLILDRLAQEDPPATLRLSVGTAAAFPPGLVRAIWSRLDVRFMFMYGASEGVGVATTDRQDILLGSVGRPPPGSVAILGPDRRPVPRGAIGEIAFSRGQYPVQYWRDESVVPSRHGRSAGAFVGDDWFHTGDLGRLDSAGRLFVIGRIKHQIDRGGLKVDPVEVEAALMALPGTADAAVVGRPNRVLGESVCACLVPVVGWTPTLEEVRGALSDVLSPYKLPEELIVMDEIPRTSLGKVDLERLSAAVETVDPESVRR